MEYTFKLTGKFAGGRQGIGEIQTDGYEHQVSIGKEMSGPGIGTNPDELLIGSVATCYLMTLSIYLEKRSLPYEDISIETTGVVSEDGGLHFEEIRHYPVIHLNRMPDPVLKEQLFQAMRAAEAGCMIAKALQGNVKIHVTPDLKINK